MLPNVSRFLTKKCLLISAAAISLSTIIIAIICVTTSGHNTTNVQEYTVSEVPTTAITSTSQHTTNGNITSSEYTTKSPITTEESIVPETSTTTISTTGNITSSEYTTKSPITTEESIVPETSTTTISTTESSTRGSTNSRITTNHYTRGSTNSRITTNDYTKSTTISTVSPTGYITVYVHEYTVPTSAISTSTEQTATTNVIISTTLAPKPTDGCTIDPLELFYSKAHIPLIIDPKTGGIVYPKHGEVTVTFATNQELWFSCINKTVKSGGSKFTKTVNATCKSGQTFVINNVEYEWNTLACSGAIEPNVRQLNITDLSDTDPAKNCNTTDLTLAIIEFPVYTLNIPIIIICFNFTNKLSVYSGYTISSSINNITKQVTPSSFQTDNEYYLLHVAIKDIYTSYVSTLNQLLDLPSNSTKYFNTNYRITTGLIAAQADFYYPALQNAASRYINTAPKWSTNDDNWNRIEIAVRRYASTNNIDLQIWAGTYGVTTLKNENTSSPTDLFLYNHTKSLFPVPEAFWKLVYNPVSLNGVILVGHNNPYENFTEDMTICSDVSDKTNWFNWDRKNVQKGYSYACFYNDTKFHKLIPSTPQVNVKDLLI